MSNKTFKEACKELQMAWRNFKKEVFGVEFIVEWVLMYVVLLAIFEMINQLCKLYGDGYSSRVSVFVWFIMLVASESFVTRTERVVMPKQTRQQKYPNTDTFVYHNANPKGRVTGDCVFRAVSTALDQSWEQTVMEMAELSCKTGFALNDTKGIEKYMNQKGWKKMKQPRKPDNTKYTGNEFCKIFNGTCVANIGGHHTVCIKNGKVHDIWDSTDGCIGNYWVKD